MDKWRDFQMERSLSMINGVNQVFNVLTTLSFDPVYSNPDLHFDQLMGHPNKNFAGRLYIYIYIYK